MDVRRPTFHLSWPRASGRQPIMAVACSCRRMLGWCAWSGWQDEEFACCRVRRHGRYLFAGPWRAGDFPWRVPEFRDVRHFPCAPGAFPPFPP